MTSPIELIDDSIDVALQEDIIDEEQAETARLYTDFESGTDKEKLLMLIALLSESEPPDPEKRDEKISSVQDYTDTLVNPNQIDSL